MRLTIPTIEIKSRKVDVPVPDVRRESSGFELPKVDLAGKLQSLDLHRPDVSAPDLSGTGKAVSDTLDAVGGRLGALGREVRSVRVTRQPEPNVAGTAGAALLGGLGAGLALMFFFDPEEGRRRRALLRDKLVRLANVLSRTFSGQAQRMSDRAAGVAHQVRSATGGARADDATSGATGEALVAETPDAASDLASVDAAARSGGPAVGGALETSSGLDTGSGGGGVDDGAPDSETGWPTAGDLGTAPADRSDDWGSGDTELSRESAGYVATENGEREASRS